MYQRLFLILLFLACILPAKSQRPSYYGLDDQVFFALPQILDTISIDKPDTLLLDAAIFQATNKIRRENGLPPFLHDACLYQASSRHATHMIERNFYGHDNPYSTFDKTVDKRVDLCSKRFRRVAENIGRYTTITGNDWLAVRWVGQREQYEFINPEDNTISRPYSYASYAYYIVGKWMASSSHRSNILNETYAYIGCAGRLSTNPYKARSAPFACVVQSFGSER